MIKWIVLGVLATVVSVCLLYRRNKARKNTIPKTVHFVYGLEPQTEPFHIIYAIAILSAYSVLKPDKIYFWYHHEPIGSNWERIKPLLLMKQVEIPTHIGKKPIKKLAHKADLLRNQILGKHGGIYLDIDTICVKPVDHLLSYEFVIGKEDQYGLCNAIFFTSTQSAFFQDWMKNYESSFKTDGWNEASVQLPKRLSLTNVYFNTLFADTEVFLKPSWTQVDKIFMKDEPIPAKLHILHLWNSAPGWKKYKVIENFNTMEKIRNSQTLYGRMVRRLDQSFLDKYLN